MNSTCSGDPLTESQQTALVWSPSILLWLFIPVDLYCSYNSGYRDIPWSWNNVTKLVVNGLLVLISIFNFIYALTRRSDGYFISAEDVYSPFIQFVCLSLCFGLTIYHKKWGRMSSELLFGYWICISVLGLVHIFNDLYSCNEETDLPLIRTTYFISYGLGIIMVFLNCFADARPQRSSYPPVENSSPELSSSFPSRLLYRWFDNFIKLGFRKPVENSDLWNLNNSEMTKVVSKQFDQYWNRRVSSTIVTPVEELIHLNNATKLDGDQNVKFIKGKIKNNPDSIVMPLCKAFGGTFLFGSAIKLVQTLTSFANPLVLELLIDFIGSEEQIWKGYMYAIILFGNSILQTLLSAQFFHKMSLTGLRVRTCLMSAIYKKALRISNASRKESAMGEIVNLMAVDCQRFMPMINNLNMIWVIPIQIVISIYLLWNLLGPSALAGFTVLVAFLPISAFVAKIIEKLHSKLMKCKDERVKTMGEILSGIKVLKLYAWEPCFEDLVMKIRNKETKVLKHIAYCMSSLAILWFCTPFLVGLVTFTIFVYSDPKNILDAKVAFVSFALINLIRVPLCSLPLTLTSVTQGWVSLKRINNFLNLEELEPDSVTHDPKEDDPVVMKECTFSWDDEGVNILKDITLRVKEGSLVAVVGAVGSGKSSLLSAILGEMDKITGRVNTKGSIAYVPQIAWIQNATVKNNILFGKQFDEKLYDKVIEACALSQDLEILPGGDRTEIGEKGINLSGGQKQRVSLARAVYYDSDIYLLDDPLSAVDSHVGKHIFQNVIGPDGLLRKKTRLFVTHGISYLPEVDHIVVLKDGSISEMGTYNELMDKKGAFSDFIRTHTQEESPDDEQEKEDAVESADIQGSTPEHKAVHKSITRQTDESVKSVTSSEEKALKIHSSSENIQMTNVKNEKNDINEYEKGKGEKLTEEERAEVGNVKFEVYKKYMKSMGVSFCLLTIFLHTLFESLAKGTDVWLAIWSSDPLLVVNGTQDTARLNNYIIVYSILGLCQGAASMFTDLIPVLACWLAGISLHKQLLHTTLRLPLSFFDTTPTGRILARFSKDLDMVDCIIPRLVGDFTWCIFTVFGTLVIISYSTAMFIVTIIPLALLYYFIQKYFVATSRQLSRLESVSRSPIYNHFSESISGSTSIRAYGGLNRFICESEKRMDDNSMTCYPNLMADRWLAVRLDLLGNLIVLFAAMFAVQAKTWISAGLAGLSISHSLQIADLFNLMVRLSSGFEVNIVAAERIKEYTDVKHEAEWDLDDGKMSKDWPDKGHIEFKEFSVRYRDGLDCVLKGVTFSISGGEKVGVVGRTGAGKSSLTLSLFRIIEAASGSILIDGVDISTLGLHTLRSRLTIIPQDPVLFSGSLRMNLDPFNKYSDHQIWSALEHSHLKDFVKGLNDEIHCTVSEGGENFSVGQRQLICLARALLRKTKVLILDEATAAVDLETDNLIQKTILSEFADCTVLTVAHRINTIMDSNRVIVLDRGLVIEFDSPDNLLKNKKSIFFSMAQDAGLA